MLAAVLNFGMSRFETIGRIVEHLHSLEDASLEELLADLSGDIADETMDVVTYGKDDTEHLQSSPANVKNLERAMKELEGRKLLMPEPTS